MMNTLFQSLSLGCLGVMLAWLLRRPLRRLAGPGPTFCLWSLPCLLAAVAWLPTWTVAPMGGFSLPTLQALWVTPTTPTNAAASGISAWLCLWLAGCGVMLSRLAIHYLRIMRTACPLPSAMREELASHLDGRKVRRLRLHPVGPAVLWGPRCRVLLPTDFLDRFDAGECTQVLAHEFTHLRRGDPWWSLIAELALAALWFFPPAWLAMSRFHLDQELACDAAVLRRAPGSAARYARTLLDSNATVMAAPAMNPWLSRPQLKERLVMIQRHPMSHQRRCAGYLALAALLAGSAFAAQAALPHVGHAKAPAIATAASAETHPASVSASPPPRYPEDAIKNKQQGTVILLILTTPDGQPSKTKVSHSSGYAALDQAAINAAMKWRFHPRMVDGHPSEGWVKVPVTFSLYESTPPSGQPHATGMPALPTSNGTSPQP